MPISLSFSLNDLQSDCFSEVPKFSEEEIEQIVTARKANKDKRAEARLKALELRARGLQSKDVAKATGFHAAYITTLVRKYRQGGLEAIAGIHYGGNRRNMSAEKEVEILAPFKERAEKGEIIEISEIESAYQAVMSLSWSQRKNEQGGRESKGVEGDQTEEK